MDLAIGGPVAMVAAASKGLGRAVAEALAREGCRLSICSRSVENLAETRAAIERAGAETLTVKCDVSVRGDLARWFEATEGKFGSVDILVTNTGGPPAARFLDLRE